MAVTSVLTLTASCLARSARVWAPPLVGRRELVVDLFRRLVLWDVMDMHSCWTCPQF
jgi:hypothetical protein